MSDELNPAFAFNLTATPLLLSLLKDPTRVYELVSEQLASRGLDMNGKWVGFEQALTLHHSRINGMEQTWPSASN